jgi:hypothetical protein
MFATWDLAAEQINENLAKGETSIDVKRRVAHAMFTAKLGHRHTAFCLTQGRKDLGFAISRHQISPWLV